MTIIPDTKDWTWVLRRPCPECGFDTQGFAVQAVPDMIVANAAAWRQVLTAPGDLRRRPVPGKWAPVEYGCHVRDVFRLYDQRLELMLTIDDPLFPNWDQDATAVADRYQDQDPAEVAAALSEAGQAIASRFASVTGGQWQRTGRRSDGASFTVETFARYLIHDPVHHLYDVTGQLSYGVSVKLIVCRPPHAWPMMAVMATTRRADMFTADGKPSDDDPRENRPRLGDERVTLVESLRKQRLTLEIKCAGLDAEAMARRSVEPSTMSLLGLVRHLAEGERATFRVMMAGQDVPRLFTSATDRDGDFDGAVPDPQVVAEAWDAWRAEVDFATRFVAEAPSLDLTGDDPLNQHGSGGGPMSLREVLVGMIEEYARHMGHADLLRERIDGRLGQ